MQGILHLFERNTTNNRFKMFDDLGIKVSFLVAGLFGAIASLSLVRQLNIMSAIGAFTGGVACAAYFTSVVADYLGVTTEGGENAVAFMLGLTGMNVVAGVFKLSERFKENPTTNIAGFLRGEGEKKDE